MQFSTPNFIEDTPDYQNNNVEYTSLNDISNYLASQDNELNTSMRDAERNISQLTL